MNEEEKFKKRVVKEESMSPINHNGSIINVGVRKIEPANLLNLWW